MRAAVSVLSEAGVHVEPQGSPEGNCWEKRNRERDGRKGKRSTVRQMLCSRFCRDQ